MELGSSGSGQHKYFSGNTWNSLNICTRRDPRSGHDVISPFTRNFDRSTMLQDVPIPVLPSTTNSMVWSEDGEIAVAAGEYVHLLVRSQI